MDTYRSFKASWQYVLFKCLEFYELVLIHTSVIVPNHSIIILIYLILDLMGKKYNFYSTVD